ncbi:response regulator receiver (CheY-like) modulated diguanylate cyclase/phosphodiesterase [Sulfurimonas gotlandica GD1]|uniref:Response regulator receiver (CheY-like) modulated diguanylate cyclase/phosphodiesterase n=1 Tax=Sulfurimonas gotlandica (strain DSM 19862 / JCM 16533 / GD1) TaxID=929558 RepID=B6BH83_SULGG|nr:EAL domain-containing protein [Sulfurimonas gotlandica]EDZ63479.1 diguanylate cyclase/phosphodiesterase [Sulfurimonas gotlandica GD1]EHP29872.1 response regulator receiver (CheY-like) modulated diguanylate cyclase/phosphodiesterase [Sulfurimonas gotlandica GD1]
MNKEHFDSLIKSTKKLSILYVEDDKLARDSTLKFLETFFLKIDIAVDGEQAYAKKQLKKYDIIITDINMPKLNGIELIEKIRKHDASTPILILSAYDDRDYFVQSIKFGVDGYILKPVELGQFNTIISKIVKRIDLERSLSEYQNNLEQKVEEKTRELRYRCYHEFHTDLPNSQQLQADILKKDFSYILLLDISHFSTINKEYGKVFANHVLVRTARMLEYHIHKKAKLYKIESDRFVIMLKDATSEDVHEYCNQIVAFFDNKNVKVDEAELSITFNIGVAKIQDDITETLINCEYALDKSKDLGSRRYEVFDDEISCFRDEKEAIRWLRTTRMLILEDKIEPYFQPIQDIKTNEILKYEVLARGILGDRIVSPIYFIPPAEKLGLITSITRIMINKSFAFFQDKTHQFSINITERDLLESYLVDFLNEKMATYNISADRVTFEILENITLVKNNAKITEQLNGLRAMGFKIAIDDFGIENSNFSRLLEINLDFIKIDGVFIRNLKENARNRTITKAIVNLSKTLGIKTIAEFVEDEDIYNIIKECGIDYAQGYYIGKPEAVLIS